MKSARLLAFAHACFLIVEAYLRENKEVDFTSFCRSVTTASRPRCALQLSRKSFHSFDLLSQITRYIQCNTTDVHINYKQMPSLNIPIIMLLHFTPILIKCHGIGGGLGD